MRVVKGWLAMAALVAMIARTRALDAQQVAYSASVAELDSATMASVNAQIARARLRGTPEEPLIAKVREGQVKGATGMLIRTAVAKLAERLDSARAALGPMSTEAELVAGAQALAVGADVASLRALRAASAKPVAAPIGTLAQLVASGVAPRRAVEMIVTLLRRNATPAMVIALGNLVERDVATGLRPDEAALIRLRGIEGTLGVGSADALSNATAPSAVPGVKLPSSTAPKRRP